MKKYVLSLFALLLTITVNAASLEVVSGSPEFLKKDASACVEFDFSGAAWGKKETLEERFKEDYPELIKVSETTFIDFFNKKTKHLRIVNKDENPQYKIVFKFDKFQSKFGNYYRKYTRIWGTATVTDLTTNETVCTIQINNLSGDSDYVPKESFWKGFMELGEKFAKMK